MAKKEVKEVEITATLKGWAIQPIYQGSTAIVARGACFGDIRQRFLDGEQIRTSSITKVDLKNRLVHTLNSVYKLDVE